MPVGRRDDRRSRAHRVRERAARDLGLVEVRAHEDVGRLQVAAQLLRRDVLIAEHDVLANAQLLGEPLERRAVGLAVLAKHGGVRGAHDEVDEIGTSGDEGGQGADDGLDALVWTQQAEGQQHALTGDAEARLEALLVARRHVGDAVRDDLDARALQLVAPRQQIRRDLAHDDEHRRLGHLLDDRPLRRRRRIEDGVQRDGRGHAQRAQKIQDVRAIVAAEDPVLVLERHPADGLVVHQLGRARVVALRPLANLVLDVRRVVVLQPLVGDGHDERLHAVVGREHPRREIARERRDPAAPRRIGTQKRDSSWSVQCSSAPSIDRRESHGVSLDGVHQVATLGDRPAAHSATAAGHPLVRSVRAICKRMSWKSYRCLRDSLHRSAAEPKVRGGS